MAETSQAKIVRLETQMTNVVSEIAEVKGLVKEIIIKVDYQAQQNSEIKLLQTTVKNLDFEIKGLQAKLDNAEKRRWVSPTVVGIACSVAASTITFLVIEYLRSK